MNKIPCIFPASREFGLQRRVRSKTASSSGESRANLKTTSAFRCRGETRLKIGRPAVSGNASLNDPGNKCLHAFCGTCGTPIYACAVDSLRIYGLGVGTIIQRAALAPQRQIWRRSALPWVDALATVPAVEKG